MNNLITDVPGILVGQSETIADSPLTASGVTVIVGEQPMTGTCIVSGGAPASRETALLAPDKLVTHIDALVLSGGSAFGLAAADRLMSDLAEQNRGFPTGIRPVPIVPAASLFDLRLNPETVPDYHELAHQAFLAKGKIFSLGNHGAGTGATAGVIKGGIGSASTTLPGHDEIVIGALAAVNSFGSVLANRRGTVWAAELLRPQDDPDNICTPRAIEKTEFSHDNLTLCKTGFHRQNTTLAVIATNLALSKTQLMMLCRQARDGLARAIVPCHTVFDGDILFAVSTGQCRISVSDEEFLRALTLSALTASNCLSRSVIRAIIEADSLHQVSAYCDFVKIKL